MSAQSVIVKQLTEQHLPIFSHSVSAFREAIKASVLNWKTIGDIILKDPGLVLHTLQILYSSSRGRSNVEVSDMAQAIMLLGMDRVRTLTLGLPVLEKTLDQQTAVRYTKAVNRAFHAAYQARNWAQWRHDFSPDEIFMATLLHSIPELALWVSAPQRMQQMRRRIYKDGMPADEAQHLTLGNSLQHYGRMVTSDMHLPAFVHEVLRPENARLPRVQNVLMAVQLANTVEFGWYSEEVTGLMAMVGEFLNKSLDETTRIVHITSVKAARESAYNSVRPAAALLALIPPNDDRLIREEFPEETESENASEQGNKPQLRQVATEPDANKQRMYGSITIEPAAKKAATSHQADEITPDRGLAVCLSPQKGLFSNAVKELEAGMGKLSATDIIRCAVHGMHDGAGFHRVVFAAIQPGRPCLEARFMVGSDNDPAFNKFQIKLDSNDLFSRLLEKTNSVWINNENRNKFWQSIPTEFKTLIKVNTFCAMSVHVDSKPVGMFYADRHSVDCEIDKRAYTMFRHLGQLAGKCLAAKTKA